LNITAEEDLHLLVQYKQWSDVDGKQKIIIEETTVENLIDVIVSQLIDFKVHCYVKRQQSDYFEKKKSELVDGEIVLQIDFAKNYCCLLQDEIQAAYWNHNQVTIFTAVAWIGHESEVQSLVVISDDMTHGKKQVFAFLYRILTSLKTKFPSITHDHVFSDGCCAQFKNKFNFANLTFFPQDYGLTATWSFFPTSHGKGAVDGVGAVVKRNVWLDIIKRKCSLSNAEEFYESAKSASSFVDILYVSSLQVKEQAKELEQCWLEVDKYRNVSNTLKIHLVAPINPFIIDVSLTSHSKPVRIGILRTSKQFSPSIKYMSLTAYTR
jgi:hypothetical protein